VKSGADTKPEQHNSESGHEDLELSMSDQTESQTQLNFTAEIGTLDYTSVCVNDFHVEGRSLSAKEDFLNRIQREDPLEGSSWHFQSVGTPTRRKRINSKSLYSCQSSKKVVTVNPTYNEFQFLFILLCRYLCQNFKYKVIQACEEELPKIDKCLLKKIIKATREHFPSYGRETLEV
jgi:hypothetical protein